MTDRANEFFYQSRHATTPTAVDPHELRVGEDVHRRYMFSILAELDRMLPAAGLTFLLTWDLNRLDERFHGSVVLVYDDDQIQRVLWAPAARVIFKNTGLGPESLRHTASLPPALSWRVALRDLRNLALQLSRAARNPVIRGTPAPTFQFPLGVSALVELPEIPFEERPVDLFFAGSVGESGRFTVRPRVAARRAMEAAIEASRRRFPDLAVDFRTFAPFGVHSTLDERILASEDYAARLTSAKYALCPRGNVQETYRVFEAGRSGCVPIGEPLPPRWYFAGAPYVPLRRWSHLPDALAELRADPDAAGRLADAARAWWHERISPASVARFMRERISR